MNDNLHVNQDGLDLIMEFEGFSATPYLCPAKILTIGYGHTKDVKAGMVTTKEEALKLLQEDVQIAELVIKRSVKVSLGSNQFSALVSFVYNIGSSNFIESTLLRLLNRGWTNQVPIQMLRWNRINGEVKNGLSNRRAAESFLWSKPDNGDSNVSFAV